MTSEDRIISMLDEARHLELRGPDPDLLARARAALTRRRWRLGGVVCGSVLIVGTGGVAAWAWAGDHSRQPKAATTSHTLSPDEVNTALSVAHWAQREYGDSVTGATATAADGVVNKPNLSADCTSGHLLHVSLYGSFRIGIGGRVGEPQGGDEVSEIDVTADAASGTPCLIEVLTGPPSAAPSSQLLFGEEPLSSP